ncbi:MAG: sigma-70 family RNA polymerase sigma factor, partial [Polyangiaceae bacterium]
DDLAHDVFLAMHLRFADFDRSRPIKPWLFGITFRVASHHRRRPAYQREGLDDGVENERHDMTPLADEQLDDHRKRAMVLRLLETLDLDRRAVLIMHDLDELPMKEVAEALGIPVFTAYSRLRVAREEFAAAAKRAQLRGARA